MPVVEVVDQLVGDQSLVIDVDLEKATDFLFGRLTRETASDAHGLGGAVCEYIAIAGAEVIASEDDFLDAFGVLDRRDETALAAHRVTDPEGVVDAEGVEQLGSDAYVEGVDAVFKDQRTRLGEVGHVEEDAAIVLGEGAGDLVPIDPGGDTGAVGVEEDDGLALTDVVEVDVYSAYLDGLACLFLGEAVGGDERHA